MVFIQIYADVCLLYRRLRHRCSVLPPMNVLEGVVDVSFEFNVNRVAPRAVRYRTWQLRRLLCFDCYYFGATCYIVDGCDVLGCCRGSPVVFVHGTQSISEYDVLNYHADFYVNINKIDTPHRLSSISSEK